MQNIRINLLLKTKLFNSKSIRYYKEIKFGNDGKNLIMKGAETLANVLSVTFGPKAGNVIVLANIPTISKDGAFLANSVTLEDPYENVGVQIMKKMAETTDNQAKNSAKIATVLANNIAKEGYKKITSGSNPVHIRNGIMDGVNEATKYLDEISKKIDNLEDIINIATSFAEGDKKIGDIVGKALYTVGKDGKITVKQSNMPIDDNVDLISGMVFPSGIFMGNFQLEKNGIAKLDNPLLLIYNQKLTNLKLLIPTLEMAIAKHKSLVIIAEEFPINLSNIFSLNNEATVGVKFIAVKIPGDKEFDREILKDLAYACGGKVFGDEACELKLKNLDDNYFGEVNEIILNKLEMICIHGDSERFIEKSNELKENIDECNKNNDNETMKRLQDRLERLQSNIAIININGDNDEQANIMKDKIYKVIESTRTAIEEGIVPGSGLALIRCAEVINQVQSPNNDHRLGVEILLNSLKSPFVTILKNSHANVASVFNKLEQLPLNIGYDVVQQDYVDVYHSGIIDSTKVIKAALRNAANTASLMMNAEAVVVYKFDGTEIVL